MALTATLDTLEVGMPDAARAVEIEIQLARVSIAEHRAEGSRA